MLATRYDEFIVHVVEVCRTCSWNHFVSHMCSARSDLPRGRAAPGRRATARGRRVNSEGRPVGQTATSHREARLTVLGSVQSTE